MYVQLTVSLSYNLCSFKSRLQDYRILRIKHYSDNRAYLSKKFDVVFISSLFFATSPSYVTCFQLNILYTVVYITVFSKKVAYNKHDILCLYHYSWLQIGIVAVLLTLRFKFINFGSIAASCLQSRWFQFPWACIYELSHKLSPCSCGFPISAPASSQLPRTYQVDWLCEIKCEWMWHLFQEVLLVPTQGWSCWRWLNIYPLHKIFHQPQQWKKYAQLPTHHCFRVL